MEIWKDILGYEGIYQVSNSGQVKSLSRTIFYSDGRKYSQPEKILRINFSGKYKIPLVHLYENAKRTAFAVHRLVALAFILNPENKPDVNHISGDRTDNSVNNLEWTTRLENMQHGFETGLINNTGTNHGNNVYTDSEIKKVKLLLKTGTMTQKQVAEVTGVKKGTVEQIAQGKQWTHIKV